MQPSLNAPGRSIFAWSSASAHPQFVRIAPFALFIALLALRGQFEGELDTRWWYALQAGLTAGLLLLFRHAYVELHPSQGAAPLGRHWLLAIVAGLLVFGLWIQLTAPWMRVGVSSTTFVPVDASGQLQWPLIVVRTLGASVVVPIMEELFWRSFLMRWIDGRDFMETSPTRVGWYGVVASSVVFALGHDLWLAGLVAGLIFAQLYRFTGRLWVPIVAHAVANLSLAIWVVREGQWSFW